MTVTGKRLEDALISGFRRLPLVSFYADTRGWYFVLAWGHRVTGMLLALVVLLQILVFGPTPGAGRFCLVMAFQWFVSIPVIFHAFNGARLIRYECYGRRDDEKMVRWVFGLLLVFLSLLALLMITGGQSVSPFFYWVPMGAAALVTGYGFGARVWNKRHSFFWKWQRVSGAFLLVMVPAYVLYLNVHPASDPGAGIMSKAMGLLPPKAVYLLLLSAALFHGGYGVWTVVRDYASSRTPRKILAAAVTFFFLIFFWIGFKRIIGF